MKAIICKKFGPPESLELLEIEDIHPRDEEVKIAIEACGVNFPDTLIIENKYQFKPKLPFSPGGEITGEIIEVGKKVKKFKIGDKVMAMTLYGGFAENIILKEEGLIKRPNKMNCITAAGFTMTYGTSMHALTQKGNLKKNEIILILGAGGGVGLAAVQISKAIGAKVIAAASSKKKLDVAKEAGADYVINYSQEDLRQKLKEITGEKGVDVVFDPVGGELLEKALRSTAWNGRVLIIGFTSGIIPKVSLNLPLLKGCSIVGVFWGAFRLKETKLDNKNFSKLFAWYENGKINPYIYKSFPLQDASMALNLIKKRKAIGKIVLKT